MTELVLVRHGETVWHAENRYTGRSDIALSERGHEQAGALARWAAAARVDVVVCSPLGRARRTAEPAAMAADRVLAVDERLVEVDLGAADGHTRAEMRELFPAALAAFLDRPASCPLPGGEPGADAVRRARPVLDGLTATHPSGRVLVVAHQTLLRLLLCSLLGLDLDHYRGVFPRLENVARTVVRLDPDGTSGGGDGTGRRAGPAAALLALNVPTAG